MIKVLKNFNKYFLDQKIKFVRNQFNDVIRNFNFFYHNDNFNINDDEKQMINQSIQDSKFIIIDQNKTLNQEMNQDNLIIVFEKTLIILEISSIKFLLDLLSKNPNLFIYCLSNTKNYFEKQIKNKIIESDSEFTIEIQNFRKEFYFYDSTKDFSQNRKLWSFIISSISGYLIKKSYFKFPKNRIEDS